MSNVSTSTISSFAGTRPGTFSTTATTLTAPGLNEPTGLAFDAHDDLFATNADQNVKGNTITEFAAGTTPGTFGAAQIIDTGLSGPIFLAFGPSVSAPVPEASTTVSLGLLLALGLGGLVVAGRRKRA